MCSADKETTVLVLVLIWHVYVKSCGGACTCVCVPCALLKRAFGMYIVVLSADACMYSLYTCALLSKKQLLCV